MGSRALSVSFCFEFRESPEHSILTLSVCQVPAPPSRKNRGNHCYQRQPEGLCQHLGHLAQDHSRKVTDMETQPCDMCFMNHCETGKSSKTDQLDDTCSEVFAASIVKLGSLRFQIPQLLLFLVDQ